MVEQRLKDGRLRAIVATNSLELGIDIGSLDEVVLIQTPPTIASAVQRVGRAGHGVGETSRGRLYPLHGPRPARGRGGRAPGCSSRTSKRSSRSPAPLDVLAQVILSMTAAETWDVDELFDVLRTSYPYRELKRRQFDLVVDMLAGRYADSRVRELEPAGVARSHRQARSGRAAASRGCSTSSGGTIPDRGYFQLRHHESMAKLGELDEEFVWERSLGDTFTLGAQSWRIRKITHNDVLVSPSRKGAALAPFWRAEARNRGFFLSEPHRRASWSGPRRLSTSRRARRAAAELGRARTAMEPAAAAELIEFLERQRSRHRRPLPHRRQLLVEKLADDGGRRAVGGAGSSTPAGAAASTGPWRWRCRSPGGSSTASRLEIDADNDCLLVSLPRGLRADELLDLVARRQRSRPCCASGSSDRLLRRALSRERRPSAAPAALELPAPGAAVAAAAQRAKKLLETVARYGDFPIAGRDLAHLPRGRVRPRGPEGGSRAARARRDPGRRDA